MEIRNINNVNEKERIARQILRDLSDWFGMPEYTENYIADSKKMPFWAAFHEECPIGFIVLKQTSPDTAEVFVMGVLQAYHRMGVGTKLYEALE